MFKYFWIVAFLKIGSASASAFPRSFVEFGARLCAHPDFRCEKVPDAYDADINFYYRGEGFQTKQTINLGTFLGYDEAFQPISEEPEGTPKQKLEKKKHHLHMVQMWCGSVASGCAIAVANTVLLIPKLVLAMTCAGGAGYCTVVTNEEIEKVDKEIAKLEKAEAEVPSGGGGEGEGAHGGGVGFSESNDGSNMGWSSGGGGGGGSHHGRPRVDIGDDIDH